MNELKRFLKINEPHKIKWLQIRKKKGKDKEVKRSMDNWTIQTKK